MTSKVVSELLTDLGIVRSHSRPHTSNDNPYSESHFKTLKYRPCVPDRFQSEDEARELFRNLLTWYNEEHRHSGIAMLTPAIVHAGNSAEVVAARNVILKQSYVKHRARFVNKAPTAATVPDKVYINAALPLESAIQETVAT